MITQFHVQNFKALRDVTLALTPMHVLIGPNDSGKTSILDALAAMSRSVDLQFISAFAGVWNRTDLVWRRGADTIVRLGVTASDADGEFRYQFACRFMSQKREIQHAGEEMVDATGSKAIPAWVPHQSTVKSVLTEGHGQLDRVKASRIHQALSGVHYYRWNARFLSLPTAPDSSSNFRMEESGFGLARCLDDILGYDREAFGRLEARFKQIFPRIRAIRLIPEPAYRLPPHGESPVPLLQKAEGKGIYFQFEGSESPTPAAQVSDGVLLILAYLTVLHLPTPPRLLLVEEPENGIHPRRLADIIKILRDLIGEQSRTQVIFTTHSPYVVDLMEPEEVTLCRKDDASGEVRAFRLSDNPRVREELTVFTLGEIWTMGDDDSRLMSPQQSIVDSGQ